MKGAILSIAPDVNLVDVTHDIEPQNLMQAAFVLRQAWPAFPPETIHVVVVDPTVGSDRRILAARYNGRTVLAPDNGVISLVHRDGQVEAIHVIEQRNLFAASVSATFHGRDIFAPVAARLAGGMPLADVGPATDRITTFAIPHPHPHLDGSIEGEVIYVDTFGNLVTNLTPQELKRTSPTRNSWNVTLRDRHIGPVRHTYADVPAGEPLALIGSTGWLEIAVNGGSAADALDAVAGATVLIR
jgi:hypothetical protein